MCKEYTAPKNLESSKQDASIDAKEEICPVLNIGIATSVDVRGIDAKAITAFTKIFRMDFDSRKICERNSSSELRNSELQSPLRTKEKTSIMFFEISKLTMEYDE